MAEYMVLDLNKVADQIVELAKTKMSSELQNEKQPRWIPCSEKEKPQGQDIVLVTVPECIDDKGERHFKSVVCAYTITTANSGTMWFRSDGDTYGCLGRLEQKPIAWMPLPKPYEEE